MKIRPKFSLILLQDRILHHDPNITVNNTLKTLVVGIGSEKTFLTH
jgi:hypothetical protein